MSLHDYERFVYRACHCDDGGDAAAHWRSTAEALESRARSLADVQELRIVGPDTDLPSAWKAETGWWPTAAQHAGRGGLHEPDGDADEGEIRFQFPAIYEGREVDDVRLRFEAGEVVSAEAARGGDYLAALLETDGARSLGEVAFGLNYEVDRFTGNILFDEKIGGTMHFALGASFRSRVVRTSRGSTGT